MRALVRLGLRFDALVQPWHLQPVVIDHAAKPQLAQGGSGDWVTAWRSGLIELAALPGVQCKLSGLLTEAAGPAAERDAVRCTNAARFYSLTLPDPPPP
ncbi:MAG: hypothetical protein RL260_1387 [Pseudomonadota bacterium]|jgi:L-fuconolactonase